MDGAGPMCNMIKASAKAFMYCMCSERATVRVFPHLALAALSHQEGRDVTENCSSGQLTSCSAHRCAVKPLEAAGAEHGLSKSGRVIYPGDRDQHKL